MISKEINKNKSRKKKIKNLHKSISGIVRFLGGYLNKPEYAKEIAK